MTQNDAQTVIVVSGLPRSGTSMMMKMLEAAGLAVLTDGVRAADEDNPKGYYEFEPVKQTKQDAGWLDDAGGKVVKMVHLLLADLPTDRRYKVVMMRREPDEILASQAKMLERQGKGGGDLPAEAMKRVFAQQMEKIEAHLAANDAFESVDVSYNELLAGDRAAAERVATLLGLDGDAVDRMMTVIDPDLYRNRA